MAVTPQREALRELCRAADSGESQAIYQLARLYDTGYDSIPRDSVHALALFEQSARRGLPAAQNRYGYELIRRGAPTDRLEGIEWMTQAAMQGDASAESNLGWLFLGNSGIDRNLENAAFWLQRAAKRGVPAAESMLGDLYRDGLGGLPTDTLTAATLYDSAIEHGVHDAALKLIAMQRPRWQRLTPAEAIAEGLRYYRGRAPYIGVMLFEQAANDSTPHSNTTLDRQAKAQALALLGDATGRAIGADYNQEQSLGYYYHAAVAGNPSAQFVIAELLDMYPDALAHLISSEHTGNDDVADHASAQYWYDRAAAAGITDAAAATHALLSKPNPLQ